MEEHPPDLETITRERSRGYQVSIENILQRAFDLFRRSPAEMILFGLIFMIVNSNPLTSLLISGPFIAGFYAAAAVLKGERYASFQDFFRGFEKFAPLLIVHLLTTLIIALGFFLLIIPGLYFATVYLFSHAFVWFYDIPATTALRYSHRTISGNFWQMFLLMLIVGAINVAGAFAFGVGLLLTVPFGFCVIFAAFDDIIGIPSNT